MKISKKFMAFLFVGLRAFVGCSSTGSEVTSSRDKKSAIEQVQEYMGEGVSSESSVTASTAETPTVNSVSSESIETTMSKSTESSGNSKKVLVCGKETVTIEYSAEGDKATLTDGTGTVSELERTVSGSGEHYSSTDGKSIHLKGSNGVYKSSSKAKEVTCKLNS